jgi:hypothetical protein
MLVETVGAEGNVFKWLKLISFRDSRGWVLHLTSPAAAAWKAMEEGIPPFPVRDSAPRNLENALRLDHFFSGTTAEKLAATNRLLSEGCSTALLRAVRPDEKPYSDGLLPKNPLAKAQPLDHVLHGSSSKTQTQFISFSEDPTVPLLWALPYGRVVVVSSVLADALKGDSMFIRQSQLKMLPDPEAREFVERSGEALANGPVPAGSVDELSVFFAAHLAEPALIFPSSAARDVFPANIMELNSLEVAAEGPSLHCDMSAALLSVASPAAHFVILRMQRNSLPYKRENGGALDMGQLIELGRAQLRAALEAFTAERESAGLAPLPLAYYEADVAFAQPRLATDLIPSRGLLQRLPFVLARVPERREDWPAFGEQLHGFYKFKKGAHKAPLLI